MQSNNISFENHALKNENTTLKKELMLVSAECNKLKEEKQTLTSDLKHLKLAGNLH